MNAHPRTSRLFLAALMLCASGGASAQLAEQMAVTAVATPPPLSAAPAVSAAANAQSALNQSVAAHNLAPPAAASNGLPPNGPAPHDLSMGAPASNGAGPAAGAPTVPNVPPAPAVAVPTVPPAPLTVTPATATPDYVVPGEDQLQETARITGLASREKAEAELEQIRQQRELGRLKFESDLAAARNKVEEAANGGVKKKKTDESAEIVQHAYVNSIYRFGAQAYAEMMVGRNRVVAQEGTRLIDGSHVARIEESAVTVKGPHGTFVLPVRGSAGYDLPSAPAPVAEGQPTPPPQQ